MYLHGFELSCRDMCIKVGTAEMLKDMSNNVFLSQNIHCESIQMGHRIHLSNPKAITDADLIPKVALQIMFNMKAWD